MKKLLCMLLVCMFSVLLFCGAALAEPVWPNIYVEGGKVLSYNADDVLWDGTVSYDLDTNTLTLNNAAIESDSIPHGITASSALNIHLIGKNTIDIHSPSGYGIWARDDLTFSGEPDASLSVTGRLGGIYIAGDLNMNSGTLYVESECEGIYISKDLNMTGGAISAFGTGERGNGLSVFNDMNIGSGIRMLEAGSASGAIFGVSKVTLDNPLLCKGSDGVSNKLTDASHTSGSYFCLKNGDVAKYVIIATQIPSTGDASMPALWAGLLMLSAVGLVIIKKRGIA